MLAQGQTGVRVPALRSGGDTVVWSKAPGWITQASWLELYLTRQQRHLERNISKVTDFEML